MKFECDQCKQRVEVDDNMAGLTLTCPSCSHAIVVPGLEAGSSIEMPDPPIELRTDPEPAVDPEQPVAAVESASAGDGVEVSFVGQSGGCGFQLPTEGWARYSVGDEREIDADLVVQHEDIGLIKVMVGEWRLDFDDLREGLVEAYKSEMEDFELLGVSDATMAGRPALKVEYEGVEATSEERLKVVSHVILLDDGTLIQLLALAVPVAFGRLRKEAAYAASTFTCDPQKVEALVASGGLSPERTITSPDQVPIVAWMSRGLADGLRFMTVQGPVTGLVFAAVAFSILFFGVGPLLFGPPLLAGLFLIAMRKAQGESVTIVGELLQGFGNWGAHVALGWRTFIAMGIALLICGAISLLGPVGEFVGTVAFCYPGYRLFYAYMFLSRSCCTGEEAFATGWAMTKGVKFAAFYVVNAFAVFALLMVVPLLLMPSGVLTDAISSSSSATSRSIPNPAEFMLLLIPIFYIGCCFQAAGMCMIHAYLDIEKQYFGGTGARPNVNTAFGKKVWYVTLVIGAIGLAAAFFAK